MIGLQFFQTLRFSKISPTNCISFVYFSFISLTYFYSGKKKLFLRGKKRLFHQMVLKEKKKAFGPQIISQSKVSESQESSDKGRPLKKKNKKGPHVTYIPTDKTQQLARQPKSKRAPHHQGEQTQPLFCYQTPLMMELATNKIKGNSMLRSTADIQANKHQIKQAVMKLDDLDGPRSTSFS